MAVERTTKQRRIGFLQQADWSTPQAASANFETLSYDAGSVIVDDSTVLNTFDVTSTTGLMPKQSRAHTDGVSGLSTIAFSAPATRKALAPHLVAALQSVTENPSTPYQKTIVPAFDAAIIDFPTGGYTHTIATDNLGAADGVILENAVLDSLTITVEPNAQGIARLAKISGTWIGNEMNHAQNLSGTWVAESLANFYNDDVALTLTASIGSLTNYCWKRYTLTINNSVTSDCKVAGKANNYKFSPSITTSITLPYTEDTIDFLAARKAGTVGNIVLATTTSSGTAGHLSITSYGRITVTPHGTDGAYETIEVTIQNEVNTIAGQSLSVVIADATDRNYPAPA